MALSKPDQELIDILKKGEMLCKVPRSGPPKFRTFWISPEEDALHWKSRLKLKSHSRILLNDVKDIVRGQKTDVFTKTQQGNEKLLKEYEDKSFSLVCKDRTIDFICQDMMQCDTWFKGLSILIKKRNAKSLPLLPEKIAEMWKQEEAKSLNRDKEKSRSLSKDSKSPNKEKEKSKSHNESKPLNRVKEDPVQRTNSLAQVRATLKKVNPNALKNEFKKTVNVTSQDKGLFQFVVVVKLKNEGNQMKPFISYSFPPSYVQKKSDVNLLQSIPQFCFPDIDLIKPTKKLESKTYSFVLTDIDGSRRFGYCRRMLPRGDGPRWPETYCIISGHPCFGLFSQLLDAVDERNAISSVAVFSFLKTVLAHPFPEPGSCVSVKSHNPKTGKMDVLQFVRPAASDILEHVDFTPLFKTLGVDNVMVLLTAVLLESRILFISNDISLLSACAHAAIAMIYPFTWQHVFIPSLPRDLMDYVCSPVPFVMGILSIYRNLVNTMPTEEIVYFDLDKKTVKNPVDVNKLPANPLKQLKNTLKACIKRKPLNNSNVAKAFLDFFVSMFGAYKKFLRSNKPGEAFDFDGFLKSKPSKEQPFFKEFKNSQMFERWAAELENQRKSMLELFQNASSK